MSTVFVHGVPETPVIWDPLIDALGVDDPICLRLPGFGSALSAGFEPTMDGYATWLHEELAAIDGSIDLVTHDWGALLATRVNAQHPALVRSWVTDMGNLDDDFEWHDTARTWQTPGDGEAFMDGITALSDDERAELLAGLGIESVTAAELSPEVDATMGAAILSLYRSATRIGVEWGPGIDDIVVPTLAIQAGLDPFRSPGAAAAFAARTGAIDATLAEAGHWWMTTHADEAAAAIREFWASL
ncbi:MAG: alpha/beta hydrolase [Acidimicrobiales bacterium]